MTIYVIIKWTGNRWQVKGNAFTEEDKALAYVKDDDTLRYTNVNLDKEV